jgi:hypothetical protein
MFDILLVNEEEEEELSSAELWLLSWCSLLMMDDLALLS